MKNVKKILTIFLIFSMLMVPFLSFAQETSELEDAEDVSLETSEEDLDEMQLKADEVEENAGEVSNEQADISEPEIIENEEVLEEAEDEETSDMEKDLSLPGMSLKAAANERVSYSGKRVGKAAGETTVFSVTSSDGNKYTGTCSKQGVSMHTSGHATVTQIANNTKIAKILYYYCVQLGNKNWWTSKNKTNKVGKLLGFSSNSDTNVTKRRMIECFCQIYSMGSGTGSGSWYKVITNSSTGGWSTNTAEKVRQFYININNESWYQNLTVPDEFEVWACASENSAQPFIMWAVSDSTDGAYCMVKKVSSNSETNGNPNYSLAGAVYTIYTDSSCSTPLKDDDGDTIVLITDANGESDSVEVDADTDYWVKETTKSTGFDLDTNVYQIHPTTANDEDNPWVISSTEPYQHVDIEIHKSVTNPNVVAGNALYSVEGTTFKLYKTQTDAQNDTNAVASFSINANGVSSTASLIKGNYYLVETAAGPGLLIPSSLTKASGGYAVTLVSTTTINIP